MAKQLGIHQIRGKVGERSYYKTKGVEAGISRSINQGLSARVKSGDEYANTRLNNAEFKTANAIATKAFNSVSNRKKGMMRLFAIATMTKKALDDIKQGAGAWGVRVPATELDALICDLLENYAKGGAYDSAFGTITAATLSNTGDYTVTFMLSKEIQQLLAEKGIDGAYFVPSKALAGTQIVDDSVRVFAGSAIGTPHDMGIDLEREVNVTLSGTLSTPASVGMSPSGYAFAQQDEKHGFYVVVTILPYKELGGSRYVLQELCTYAAIPLGQIPE